MDPIQQAIGGAGYDDGPARDPVVALEQFYAAFNRRDLALMAAHWVAGEEAVMDNPLGGIARGWDAVRAVYERIFGAPVRVQVELHDYTIHEGGALCYAVGRERGTLERGDRRLALAIRTTRVFRRVDGVWRQVHHHGSMDDPALLRTYQDLVRGP
jgi:ketosteroid isomerase-like protein